MNLESYLSTVQGHVNTLLQGNVEQLEDHAPLLKQAIAYALLNGGKRVRPFLTYATGEMLSIPRSDLDVIAVSLEMMHAYSLIHDDLPAMDNDELRRGKPTCHIAFDEATAILAGDALQARAFDTLAHGTLTKNNEQQRVALLRQLSLAGGYQGMCGGQAMDLAATNQTVDEAFLARLHQKKTGALLKASVLMPVTLATQVSASDQSSLASFASTIGLAFQVQDDILDVTGDSATLGKPQGSDQALNKSTYPALLGLEGAQDYLHTLHQQALQALTSLPYNTEVLRAFADYIVKRNH